MTRGYAISKLIFFMFSVGILLLLAFYIDSKSDSMASKRFQEAKKDSTTIVTSLDKSKIKREAGD